MHNCQRGRGNPDAHRSGLDWVIVGGESGQGARPMHPDWARSLRDQCAAASVPFFFKQWGAWIEHNHELDGPNVREVEAKTDEAGAELAGCTHPGWITHAGRFFARETDITERARLMDRVGKRAAGRTLDGRTHDDRPPLAHQRDVA
jgi:protein gp37